MLLGALSRSLPLAMILWAAEPPTVMRQQLKRSDPLQLWYLHVWVWQDNPSGLFADLKVDGAFERFRVTTRREQERFLARTRRAAGAPPRVSRPRTS